MSIIAIQLKQVLRNRRFFLFTILLPGIWYVFMIQVASTSLPATGNFQLALLLLALLMGILGNSIVTFSKRICSNKDFYILQSHISHYSLWNYLFSQLITQVIINLFITLVIMILAIFLHTIEFNFITITSILLTNIIGIYLSVIGFAIGLSFDAPTVDAAGTPILFIIATFIIPWKHLLPANSFINFFTNVQKLFPTYYLYWASYRLASLADYNSCIGVMLDKKQLQVYLMFQHYKSEQRQGTPDEYNQLLDKIPEWANDIDTTRWYLWDKDEMEFSDHMSLTKYVNSRDAQQQFNSDARKTSFLLGKFAFRGKDQVNNMEEYISSVIRQLTPLYEELK